MKFALPIILAAWIPAQSVRASALDAAEPAPPSVPEKSPETLVEELADESFKVRERASLEVWKLGDSVLPLLREAAASRNPEKAVRARELLRKIQLHITPDTDPSIIELVERYASSSSAEEKQELLGKMRGKRAWRQMLKLYASEGNNDIRRKIQPAMNGIAVRAARERLLAGDAAGAREFLEMAPVDVQGLLALSEFHRSHGTLEREIERATSGEHPENPLWLLALYRSAGDLEAARRAALAAGETRIAASLAALCGDPVPWLRTSSPMEESNPVVETGARIATKRWNGTKARSSEMEPILKALNGRNAILRDNAVSVLFLLGETKAAEAAYRKSLPFAAFSHFETLERVPEAIEALGLDPEDPDYKGWVAAQIKYLDAEDIEDQHEASNHADKLSALANFLERRGLHDVAWEAYSEPLAKMADKDSDAFLDLLGSLFGTSSTLKGAPTLAKRVGIEWAGDDPGRWDDIVATSLGDEDSTRAWWSWLEDLAPESTRAERLDGMLALHGIGNDPKKLRRKWLGLAWKSLEEVPEAERDAGVVRIFELSAMTGDVASVLKAWDAMGEADRENTFWEQMLVFFSAEDRWEDAADLILGQIDIITEAKQDPGSNLHAYAAAALRMAGREEQAASHDVWVEKLTLGNPVLALQAGNAYAFGRDYTRAATWWARAATLADPDSREFPLAIKIHSDTLLEQGKWLETAATSEVLARIYASPEYRHENPLAFMRQRLQADMARAFSILESDRERAIRILADCHRTFIADGSLADHFFPSLRRLGLIEQHDQWFDETWKRMEKIIDAYPESDNSRNTAAWFASRALRKLDEGEKHIHVALALNPDQPAYLDTMAELQFARGDREKALEWSQLAISYSPEDPLIRRQHERFRSDPLPNP